jgi:hypothetical protein
MISTTAKQLSGLIFKGQMSKMNHLTLENGHGLQQWSYDLAWTKKKENISGVEWIVNECKFGGKLCNFSFVTKKMFTDNCQQKIDG